MSNGMSDSNKEYLYPDNQNNVTGIYSIIESTGSGMTRNKSAADVHDHPVYRETDFKSLQSDGHVMKKYHARFVVKKGRDGGLYAADMDQGIFTDGMTQEELVNNIHEAVECHFDVPSYEDVDIRIKYD